MSNEEITKLHNVPSTQELYYAKLFLIKEAQKSHYKEEYEALIKWESIQERSPPIKFNSTIKNGVIVMQSRLNNLASLREQVISPIIQPKNAKITLLIIHNQHQMASHTGPEVTLRNTRLNYWIPGGRRQIRTAIKLCEPNMCKHPNLTEAKQQMPN